MKVAHVGRRSTFSLGTPNNAAAVRSRLERVGNEIGVPDKVLTQLLVGVDELVSNVIKYGWPDATDGAIHEINICITPGADSIRGRRKPTRTSWLVTR
jgi:anti-sigma regulatory factor (Ser/Thr protein kinase)